ncbi:MAG: NAD(P)-dependent oxidoreductase [Clostridia bacterium]|jgi:3-hydroxyisobutyrate dehydrogenase/2-hydroxy-3-oxopropionate reductase|nr:NAD(P)-dependent oxidoreductase [Clostridia bacterium]MCI1999212.1 NAD(P)-dependent oxidoreductase [Clostridia bacterium]MCI2014835.1 NAD(P)-dependent oxidoreductase [Clostridia bacterium]
MKKIGFIGVGVMGKPMVKNLMKSGCDVYIYTRTKSKAADIISEGAKWCESVKECAKGRDIVISIVGYPKDVEEVYFGENGIIQNADRGTVIIDMTTTSPALSEKIYALAKERGLYALDAPVSGGDSGAKNGTLSIMAGGDKEVFDKVYPIFEMMGKTIIYEGKAGSGQHTKMANQIAIAGTIAGVCEAIAYADKTGLDKNLMLDSISKGAAGSWQMTNNGAKVIQNDFEPGFFIKHFIKDMKIACEEAEKRGQNLETLDTVLKMYQNLEDNGYGDLGTQALIKYYEK